MKKIVGIVAAAALATSAFADINIGSWGRTVVIPMNFAGENADGDKEVLSGAGANWDDAAGGKMGKDGISFSAASENAGFNLDVAYAGDSLGVGDNANLWVKPIDMLEVKFGKVDYNNGRQNFCYGTFDHTWRFQGLDQGEGLSLKGRGVTGFVVRLDPIENLWIDYAANVKADKAYKTLWDGASVGVGYNIPDAANIRAVVIGHDGTDQKKFDKDHGNAGAWATIQAAADITAVENLFITVGASIPTTFGKVYNSKTTPAAHSLKWFKDQESATKADAGATEIAAGKGWYDLPGKDSTKESQAETITASIGASYTLDIFKFNAFFDSKIGVISEAKAGEDYKNDGFGYAAGVGVDVNFTDSLTLITDVRFSNDVYQGVVEGNTFDNDGKAVYNRGKFGAYVGLEQKLTNGAFGVGVEMGTNKTVIQALDNSFTVAIPLMIQVGF